MGSCGAKRILANSSNKLSATSNYLIKGVETDLGVIECEYFVNCSGRGFKYF